VRSSLRHSLDEGGVAPEPNASTHGPIPFPSAQQVGTRCTFLPICGVEVAKVDSRHANTHAVEPARNSEWALDNCNEEETWVGMNVGHGLRFACFV
jgi:hypothetical protein